MQVESERFHTRKHHAFAILKPCPTVTNSSFLYFSAPATLKQSNTSLCRR